MVVNLSIDKVTKGEIVDGVWAGTGVFDVLLDAVNKNIELQYVSGKIKGTDYATAYVSSLQSTMQQAIDYVLREQMIEAQIEGILKDNEIKEYNKKILYVEQVGKDKEVAAMGLDNVMMTRKQDKELDPNYVYKPAYKENL